MQGFKHIGAGLIALGLVWASATTALADWHSATTDNFIVYGEGSARGVAREAEQLQRLDRLMRQTFNFAPDPDGRKLPVYLVRNLSELRDIHPDTVRHTGGFYMASPYGVFATLIRGDSNHTLFHEYAHHFMLQNFPGSYPGWFVEGFAEYFATADVKTASRVSLGYFSPARMYELNQGRWITMEQLLGTGDNRALTPTERRSYYALSWLLTHYMITDADRLKALGGYLQAQRQGVGWQEALQTHMGMTPEDLRKALRAYLNGQMRYGRFGMEGASIEPQTAELSAAADDFILTHAALQRPMPKERARSLRAELAPKLARYPNDPLALSVMANLALIDDDLAETERLASQLLAIDPGHVDGVRIMAQLKIEQVEDQTNREEQVALFREAQTHLVRGLETDPTDFRLYRLLARIRAHADNYPTQNDVDTLIMALSYAPQVTGLRMQTIDALRRRGLNDQAEVLMKVLQSQPHAAGEAPEEEEPQPPAPDGDEETDTPTQPTGQ